MVRVIDDEGKMLGVFQVPDAVRMAYDKGLDLIEIAPDGNPPTCKMMDFGKYKYQMKKKQAESRKKQTVITVKEIQQPAPSWPWHGRFVFTTRKRP